MGISFPFPCSCVCCQHPSYNVSSTRTAIRILQPRNECKMYKGVEWIDCRVSLCTLSALSLRLLLHWSLKYFVLFEGSSSWFLGSWVLAKVLDIAAMPGIKGDTQRRMWGLWEENGPILSQLLTPGASMGSRVLVNSNIVPRVIWARTFNRKCAVLKTMQDV